MRKIFKISFILTFLSSILLNIVLLSKQKNTYVAEIPEGSSISIMVYDENANDYVSTNAIPSGMYLLNEEKTRCVSGGKISDYDAKEGIVNFNLETPDECYLYFDNTHTFSNYLKYTYAADGTGDLYYHDGVGTYTNANLEAGDNSYRYSGKNPNNFVCFGDDCTNFDNLYRIIGIFDSRVKLIKADFANSNLLGTNGDYSSSTFTLSSNQMYAARGKHTIINTYYWDNYYRVNTWSNSRLNKTNLNINFLNNVGNIWSNLIDDSAWIVSGANAQLNAKKAYDFEIADECSDCINKPAKQTYNAKIGLMYVSDYMYAASPTYWSYDGDNNTTTLDYRHAYDYDWMFMGVVEWTISKNPSGNVNAFRVVGNGNVGNNTVYNNNIGIRPCFYLKDTVVYVGGKGTTDEPYQIAAAENFS